MSMQLSPWGAQGRALPWRVAVATKAPLTRAAYQAPLFQGGASRAGHARAVGCLLAGCGIADGQWCWMENSLPSESRPACLFLKA